jgi:hypothetical protein
VPSGIRVTDQAVAEGTKQSGIHHARRTGPEGIVANQTLLVACRAPMGGKPDDAVAGCPLMIASPFRAFLHRRNGMRRTSKRQLRMNFAEGDKRRVVISQLDPGAKETTINGIGCCFQVRRNELQDLAHMDALQLTVVSVPEVEGDGRLPRGSRPDPDDINVWLRARNRRPVLLQSAGWEKRADCAGYAEFARQHPVGSLIEARVLWLRRDKIGLRLTDGIQARMPIGDYVDRLAGWTRLELWRLPVPDRLEVIVRSVRPELRSVTVSLHGYLQDPKYCNAAAGYRRQYDAREGMFRQLPWERGRHETPELRQLPPGVAMRRLMEKVDGMLAGASPEPAG